MVIDVWDGVFRTRFKREVRRGMPSSLSRVFRDGRGLVEPALTQARSVQRHGHEQSRQ
jgi:hypothetical protein